MSIASETTNDMTALEDVARSPLLRARPTTYPSLPALPRRLATRAIPSRRSRCPVTTCSRMPIEHAGEDQPYNLQAYFVLPAYAVRGENALDLLSEIAVDSLPNRWCR